MSSSRTASVTRATSESRVELSLDLDGTGASTIDTGVPFYDHMLTAFAKHSLTDLTIRAEGDVEIDAHHTVSAAGERAVVPAPIGVICVSIVALFRSFLYDAVSAPGHSAVIAARVCVHLIPIVATLRHVAINDALSQTFSDCSFTYTRFTN